MNLPGPRRAGLHAATNFAALTGQHPQVQWKSFPWLPGPDSNRNIRKASEGLEARERNEETTPLLISREEYARLQYSRKHETRSLEALISIRRGLLCGAALSPVHCSLYGLFL